MSGLFKNLKNLVVALSVFCAMGLVSLYIMDRGRSYSSSNGIEAYKTIAMKFNIPSDISFKEVIAGHQSSDHVSYIIRLNMDKNQYDLFLKKLDGKLDLFEMENAFSGEELGSAYPKWWDLNKYKVTKSGSISGKSFDGDLYIDVAFQSDSNIYVYIKAVLAIR